MDFEKAMARLAEIAKAMDGEIPLEQSMALYTEAVQLTKQCKDYIAAAKQQIETIEENAEH